ncbi:RAD9, HUS1, RAD1-interacting nuclear orphan protein 1 [Hippocampus comes]|uniref:RAD9, HUS1, RAD1-interacting nuclear orphan protein 1 n=1 Tax=Hippocampus comes TaxID=109280 RepID=UPI00094E5D78|nr:PREDICTED: RAD9, HUS1, RAD1-interacting nuclear orphan protein 1 [Hippocampus comes]
MPRKSSKTAKPPLLFAEQPVCGARLPSSPEVRAALHPKEFFPEAQARRNLSSWVNPQFDASLEAAAPTVRRGRHRRCILDKSIRDTCSLVSKKTIGKFPPLLFQSNGHTQHHQAKTFHMSRTHSGGRGLKSVACQQDAPKRRILKNQDDGAPCFSSSNLPIEEGTSICVPPNVDTPKVQLQGACASSSTSFSSSCSALWLLAQPFTPPRCQPPDMLVPDTPERDYNLKVTWRRRTWLMGMLEERKQLAECNKLITS